MENLSRTPFALMLKDFHRIIENEPPAEKVKKELISLREKASKDAGLNIRQKDAIIARCDNYMKGEYGNTKTEVHMQHLKSNSKSKDL